MAAVMAGIVFAACKKENIVMDTPAVKQQKTEVVPVDVIPEVLYSSDGVNFFTENGEPVTGIHVELGEADKRAEVGVYTDTHRPSVHCYDTGNNCGEVILYDDVTTIEYHGRYAKLADDSYIFDFR